ncbi:MAG: manganese efflux pump [Clostridia bacterium]|nr:manganese efflux pump [Clostridia bacterium]MBQ9714745.1 manganese efflux pump [Clostridia bacterium]
MEVWEIALLGVALAMDACAVAMTDGMTNPKMPFWKALLIGAFFGLFQCLMPLLGYYITGIIADAFMKTFEKISAWVSFVLLAFLGGKMLYESIRELLAERRGKATENFETEGVCPCSIENKQKKDCSVLPMGTLLLQAVATSIDALAVGVTLQMAKLHGGLALGAWGASGLIGIITFGLALSAVYLGKMIGNRLADKAGIFGGTVLLGIGIKILLEGLL